MLSIREFNTIDLQILKTLIHTTIKESYKTIYSPEIISYFLNYHSSENIMKRAEEGLTIILESEENNMIATGTLSEDELRALYVHPYFQSKGYGRMIMTYLLKQAVEKKLKKVFLEATPGSRDFYIKFGFQLIQPEIQMVGECPLHYFRMVKYLTR